MFIFCICKSHYGVIFIWVPCTMTNQVASNFLLCKYEICSANRKLTSTMYFLFLASVIMFNQTIINIVLLKGYYKYQSFRVRIVLASFLYLFIWYDLAACCRPFLILLHGDIHINPGPKSISTKNVSISYWKLDINFKYKTTVLNFIKFYSIK